MFGPLGVPELIFIFSLALLVFGPRKLPEIGRTIGRSLAEFRKATTDLKRSLNAEMIEEEIRQSDPRKILAEESKSGSSAKKAPRSDSPTGEDAASVDESGGAGSDQSDAARPDTARRDTAPGTVSRGSVLDGDDASTDEAGKASEDTTSEDTTSEDALADAEQPVESKAQ